MLKHIVVIFLLFIFSCGDSDKNTVDDNNNDGKPGPTDSEVNLDLAVVGDSLATGFFSDITLGKTVSEAEAMDHPVASKLFIGLGALPKPAEFDAALKQNYETPFTCSENKKQSECSFSYQHKANFAHDKVMNAAVSGATVSDLIPQLDEIKKAGKAKTYIVQAGGNNFCTANFKQATYVSEMQKVIDAILGANSGAQIIITAIPDLVALYESIAPPATMALKVNQITNPVVSDVLKKTEIEFSCANIRDGEKVNPLAPEVPTFCPRVSANIPQQNSDKPAFFAAKKQELESANKAIAALITGLNNSKIKFAASVADLAFTKADISADCVHPSRAGQKKLAEAIWQYKF